jgi:hypothetical protein
MQVGCCCPPPSAGCCVYCCVHRFVQHVTAARQVQPGLFDRLDTSQQIHRCLLICLASRVVMQVGCCCPLPSAGCCVYCCVHRVCATCHCSQAGTAWSLTDLTHPNRCTDVYWYALNLVQVMQVPCSCLLLSAGCCAVAACTGFVQHVNTGGYRLQGLLHRSNTSTIVLGNSSVLLSSYCADAAVYGLFCSEYCCMHRVCASRKSDRY